MNVVWENGHFSVVHLTSLEWTMEKLIKNIHNLTVTISLHFCHMTVNYGRNQFYNTGPWHRVTTKDENDEN